MGREAEREKERQSKAAREREGEREGGREGGREGEERGRADQPAVLLPHAPEDADSPVPNLRPSRKVSAAARSKKCPCLP
eukprot:1765641-Rhodomonas_salina.1